MDELQSIFSNNDVEIAPFEKSLDLFLNRSIMLYGTSNSGKSTIIKDMLFMLKDHIPNVIVICPTNKLNHSYDDIVPKQLILDSVDEELMKRLLKRQDISVKIYNMVNNINTLEHVWSCMFKRYDYIRDRMVSSFENVSRKISNHNQLKQLEHTHKESLIEFYKQVIARNRKYISRCKGLTENDIVIVKHININPNILLIIDDAAVSASTWSKYESVKELFFNGRHHHITFMISFQDDRLLDSYLRKNAFINIFTTEKTCNAYFGRPANNFTTKEKNYMADIANAVFEQSRSKGANYRKLVYLKDSQPSCYYMVADLVDDFVFGASSLVEYCNKIGRSGDDSDLMEFSDFF